MPEAPEEVVGRYQSALAAGALDEAIALLYRDPAETHPLLQAASPKARRRIVGETYDAAQTRLANELPRLQPFWSDAAVMDVKLRTVVPKTSLEVYQLVSHPSLREPMWYVSLIRSMGDAWGIVEQRQSNSDRALVYLPGAPPVDPQRLAARYRDLFRDDIDVSPESVYWRSRNQAFFRRHPREASLLRFEGLSDETQAALDQHVDVLELSMLLEEPLDLRYQQLVEVGRLLCALTMEGAQAVYLPLANLMHEASDVQRLTRPMGTDPNELSAFWVNFETDTKFAYSRGMNYLWLPEIEVPLENAPQERVELCMNIAVYFLREGWAFKAGDTVGSGPEAEWRVQLGRRGPTAGESYGIWGAFQLTRAKAAS